MTAADAMDCLTDEAILDLAEGRRPIDEAAHAHFAQCSECRRVLAAAARGAGSTLRDAAGEPAGDGVEPAWDELGQGVVLGKHYVLEEFLGAGGMGVVWRARHALAGARVAVKIARSCDAELAMRFGREARVLGELSHPNIVAVLDVVPATPARGPAIVYELLEGETLEARLARVGTLALPDAARAVGEIAAALEHAHARGVVHRDLKPQNVFVARAAQSHRGPPGERAVVLDFGIAKLLPAWGAHSRITRTGAVLGSPRYMAPEQVLGEQPDARADVWALGAILFRALAGRGPVDGDTLGDVMKALRKGEVRDLGALAPALPADVVALARAALSVERDARLSDARAFRDVMARHA